MGGTREKMSVNSKVAIVGDGAIGKTCLLSRLTNNAIDWDKPVEYEPTTFNNFKVEWSSDEIEVALEIWDTAGQESFEQLRKLSYPGTDIYLVGYSTTSSISLTNVEHKWLPEIKENHDGGEPWVIMVGTKCDIRDGVTTADAEAAAKKINACLLIETSAKTEVGVDDLKTMIMSMANEKATGNPRPTWGGKAGFPEEAPVAPPPATSTTTTTTTTSTTTTTNKDKKATGGGTGKKPEPEQKEGCCTVL